MSSDAVVDKETDEPYQRAEIDEEAQRSSSEPLDLIESTKGEELDSPTIEEEIERVRTGANLDWDSPEDVGNPRNWPFAKRVFHTLIPALYGFVV
jgi:hypothetical protein